MREMRDNVKKTSYLIYIITGKHKPLSDLGIEKIRQISFRFNSRVL